MRNEQKAALEYLQNLRTDMSELSYDELTSRLDALIPQFPISIFETKEINRFEETQPRDLSIIYRARENETLIPEKGSFKLPFKTVSEISIIPEEKKDLIKTFGRCNKPKEPRFYASNNYPAACIEAITQGFTKGVSESKHITVGHWKIIEPLVLAHINYSENSLKQFVEHDKVRYEKMLSYTMSLDEHNLNQTKQHKPEEYEYQLELYKYFASEFSKIQIATDHDYKTINYYCDHALNRIVLEDEKTKVDGILYPSVAFSYQEMNLALHPRAMKKLKFISAMMIWAVYHGKSGDVQFIPLEQGVSADEQGNLQWNRFKW